MMHIRIELCAPVLCCGAFVLFYLYSFHIWNWKNIIKFNTSFIIISCVCSVYMKQ